MTAITPTPLPSENGYYTDNDAWNEAGTDGPADDNLWRLEDGVWTHVCKYDIPWAEFYTDAELAAVVDDLASVGIDLAFTPATENGDPR